MSQFEKYYLGIFGILLTLSIIYWGNLAWFDADKLKKRLMEDAQRHPDWLFMKGYSLKFTDKYGIGMIRVITLLAALSILVLGTLISLGLVGIIK